MLFADLDLSVPDASNHAQRLHDRDHMIESGVCDVVLTRDVPLG